MRLGTGLPHPHHHLETLHSAYPNTQETSSPQVGLIINQAVSQKNEFIDHIPPSSPRVQVPFGPSCGQVATTLASLGASSPEFVALTQEQVDSYVEELKRERQSKPHGSSIPGLSNEYVCSLLGCGSKQRRPSALKVSSAATRGWKCTD